MRIEPNYHMGPSVFTVHVDADELQCAVKKLPYPTCIGTIDVSKRKVKLWTPAASKPRGYKPAALAALTVALASKLAEEV